MYKRQVLAITSLLFVLLSGVEVFYALLLAALTVIATATGARSWRRHSVWLADAELSIAGGEWTLQCVDQSVLALKPEPQRSFLGDYCACVSIRLGGPVQGRREVWIARPSQAEDNWRRLRVYIRFPPS